MCRQLRYVCPHRVWQLRRRWLGRGQGTAGRGINRGQQMGGGGGNLPWRRPRPCPRAPQSEGTRSHGSAPSHDRTRPAGGGDGMRPRGQGEGSVWGWAWISGSLLHKQVREGGRHAGCRRLPAPRPPLKGPWLSLCSGHGASGHARNQPTACCVGWVRVSIPPPPFSTDLGIGQARAAGEEVLEPVIVGAVGQATHEHLVGRILRRRGEDAL